MVKKLEFENITGDALQGMMYAELREWLIPSENRPARVVGLLRRTYGKQLLGRAEVLRGLTELLEAVVESLSPEDSRRMVVSVRGRIYKQWKSAEINLGNPPDSLKPMVDLLEKLYVDGCNEFLTDDEIVGIERFARAAFAESLTAKKMPLFALHNAQ